MDFGVPVDNILFGIIESAGSGWGESVNGDGGRRLSSEWSDSGDFGGETGVAVSCIPARLDFLGRSSIGDPKT